VRLPRLSFLAAFASAAVLASAQSFDERVELLFRPRLAELSALSPDGQRVAYTSQAGSELRLIIMNLEPAGPRRAVKIDRGRDAVTAEEFAPVRLRFLRWASSSRLVYAPVERILPLPPLTDKAGHTTPNPDGPTISAPVMVVDVDGKERGTLVDARDFQETPADARRTLADLLRTPMQLAAASGAPVHWRMPHLEVLGFMPRDREQLVILTHGAYSPPSQHIVDLRTGDVRDFGGNWPTPPGEAQVFDWHRLKIVGERKDAPRPTIEWRDEELSRLQRDLEEKFPHRVVELLDWSETRLRVLFRVTGGGDAGRLFVLQRPEDVVDEILQFAAWLPAAKLNETRFFECHAPDGTRLTGYLTWPAKRNAEPPPLLVIFPSGFPNRGLPAFDGEAQVFADLGFAVARLNHRAVGGIAPKDLTALRGGVDRVTVDDARAVVDWLAKRNPNRPFDRARVAALGHGFGGYTAVRAVQLAPAVFRAAVAIDAPMDLKTWLQPPAGTTATAIPAVYEVPATLIDHPGADWKKMSVLDQADTLTAPVLLAIEPGHNPAVDAAAAQLRTRLAATARALETLDLDGGFAAGTAASRATVYRRIDEFLKRQFGGNEVPTARTEEKK
jgi:dienelactone hydrolase